MDARVKCPFNMQVAGPSQSGKTQWIYNLLSNQTYLLESPVKRIKWYSPYEHIPPFSNIQSYTKLPWEEGAEEEDTLEDVEGGHCLLVFDDFGLETRNSKEMTNYFTRHSHHKNISIIQVLQNLFLSGTEGRTRSLNAHYIVLMRQARDQRQIRTLARQIATTSADAESFMDAYNQAIRDRCYSYLLISLHPRDPPDLLLRSNIFPEEANNASVYLLRKKRI